MTSYLIIGNGTAGTSAAQQIRLQDKNAQITLVTAESQPLYSRIRLPEYLVGDITRQDLVIKDLAWHEERDIRLMTDTIVSQLDLDARKATLADGACLNYDRLLLAMGSRSFVPPVTGSEISGVFTLRTVSDADALADLDQAADELVMIGGGLLGLEAASAMVRSDRTVTVVEFFDRLLPRQLDDAGAVRLRKMLESMGFRFRLGAVTEEILGRDRVTGVRLKSGETLTAGAVLFSAGVRSNLDLVKDTDIAQDKGVQVNQRMETSREGVYAAGDVAEMDGVNYCIWPEATEQGQVAGINMAGGSAVYEIAPPSNILKVAGISLASAGEIDIDGQYDADITATDTTYQKIVKKDDRIIGCIMLGDTSAFNRIVKQMKGV